MVFEDVARCGDGTGSPCAKCAALSRELADAKQRLEDGMKLQTEFLSNTSHELRTPLTTILGMAELLEDEESGPLNDEQRDFLGSIKDAAHRLSGLVNDLLDLAQLEAGVLKLALAPTNLGALVAEVVAELEPEACKRGLTLEATPSGDPLVCEVDDRRIHQAVRHLVTNALKFTPAGGSVTLSVLAVPGGVQVSVHDDGIGIEAPHLPHLFERFYQVDGGSTRSHGGTGLGLSLAKGYVEAHGGRMFVHSVPGDGSVFGFTLPER